MANNLDIGASEPDDEGYHPSPMAKAAAPYVGKLGPGPTNKLKAYVGDDIGSSEHDDEGMGNYGSGVNMSKLGAGKPYGGK